ncbi:hypothetical protein AciX8_0244 [Granulicella mallensis MP5ACTX8]|uniref:Uncharacterized protein n=1 Tax=Granulicella mallensis (strain ATCC BAA-1857 / DSM 23137 / MP5ACTX8) TaxID=682795 RepID=G8NZX5_GRAMM|nr:hypothetical protein AciX8_0244 [Granulicella mallensis MP5ACTX8]
MRFASNPQSLPLCNRTQQDTGLMGTTHLWNVTLFLNLYRFRNKNGLESPSRGHFYLCKLSLG